VTADSGWIYSACYHHTSIKSPELATLFSWCTHLVELPVLPTFVFDGPLQLEQKQKKLVWGNDHWVTKDFKKMLMKLGFPYIEVQLLPCQMH
jgi:hypothetical protein